MKQASVFQFVDAQHGAGSATVGRVEDRVVLTLSQPEKPKVEVRLPCAAAADFARAILAAAGETAERPLPQSRQIGGIIGPY